MKIKAFEKIGIISCLAALLGLSAMPSVGASQQMLGDVNGDNVVNASDASLILVYSSIIGSGGQVEDDAQYVYGDVNGDGATNASDASLILVYAARIGAGEQVTLAEVAGRTEENTEETQPAATQTPAPATQAPAPSVPSTPSYDEDEGMKSPDVGSWDGDIR